MTNYDKWIAARRQEIKAQIQELEEMTPLLAAAIIDKENQECYFERIGQFDFEKCAFVPDYIGCVGCVKQWLLQEAVE